MPYSLLRSECGRFYLPQRVIMVILVTVAIIICYGQRVNFSMVVAEMAIRKNESTHSPCPATRNSTRKRESKQEWDQIDQAILLASFYVGYVLMHLPGGYVSDRFGARIIFTVSVCISSVCSCLFPPIVEHAHFAMVCIARIFIGVAQASVFPNITTLMGRWIPKTERATVGGVAFAANSWGIVIGNLMSGVFHETLGWRAVFYIWGGVGILWYFFALVWLYSDPNTHPLITDKERDFLNENIRRKEKSVKLNMKAIFGDPAIWALVAGQFGHTYLLFFLSTNMPKYFSDVLNVNMKDVNMWANSLPYILQYVSSVASGRLGDYCIKKHGWNVGFTRKFYTTIASVFPSICLLIIPYIKCSVSGVIVLLSLSLFTMGPFYCGLKVNVIDLTMNFSGFIMAIVNGLGAISGVINPYIVGWVADEHTFEQWEVVMWVIFAFASVTNVLYVVFGKAERRSWDMNDEEKEAYKQKKEDEKAEKAAKKEAKKAAKKGGET